MSPFTWAGHARAASAASAAGPPPTTARHWQAPRGVRTRALVVLAVPLVTVLSDAAAQQLLGYPVFRADLTRHVLTPGGLAALAGQATSGWAQLAVAGLLIITTLGQVACMAAPVGLWWVMRGRRGGPDSGT